MKYRAPGFVRGCPPPGGRFSGVQAQTIANLYAAMEHDLTIIPVINKIDLPSADIDRVKEEIEHDLGLDSDQVVLCSAKEGTGVDEVLEAIVNLIPAPSEMPKNLLPR